MPLDVFDNHDGVVDEDAQGDYHADHSYLVQHAAAKIVEPDTDQGHHGQNRGHQQPHPDAHAGEDHRHDNHHRKHQAPGQVVESFLYFVRLEEHLADLVGFEISANLLHAFTHPLTETDRIGGALFHDDGDQHHPLAVVPGFRLPWFHRPAPDICRRGQRHLGAIRKFNGCGANGIDIGKLAVGKHRQATAVHHHKPTGNGLVSACQRVQHPRRGYAKAVERGIVQGQGNLFVGIAFQLNPRHTG